MSMTIERAKSELMQIYGMLSPDKQRAIDTLVKIEPNWIPVGKESPVAFKKVLVTYRLHDDDSIHIGIGNTKSNINGRYYWKIDEQDFNEWDILAWMPLPKPYEPQESEAQNESVCSNG